MVTADPGVIRAADRVVLPGQSAMPDCMRCLNASGLREVVCEALSDRPFLGICLGLQMLFDDSEEGPTPCLGALAGRRRALSRARRWSTAPAAGSRFRTWAGARSASAGAHPLWHGIADETRFYFAHSYYPVPA